MNQNNDQYEDGQVPESESTDSVDDGAAENVQALDEVAQLQSNLEAAEAEAAKQRDAMLRMHAEMDNLRKRLMLDLEKSKKRALDRIVADLLPVRDSLEKGMQMADEGASVDSLRVGKAMTMKILNKVLEDHGLLEIDPQGEMFNPELHEAMSLIPSPEHPADQVIDVIQKGYQLNDRLIRPARVIVSSGSPGN